MTIQVNNLIYFLEFAKRSEKNEMDGLKLLNNVSNTEGNEKQMPKKCNKI